MNSSFNNSSNRSSPEAMIAAVPVHLEADTYLRMQLEPNTLLHQLEPLLLPTQVIPNLVRPDQKPLPQSADAYLTRRLLETQQRRNTVAAPVKLVKPSKGTRKTSEPVKSSVGTSKKKKDSSEAAAEAAPVVERPDLYLDLEDKIARLKIQVYGEYRNKVAQVDQTLEQIYSLEEAHAQTLRQHAQRTEAAYQNSLLNLGLPALRVPIELDHEVAKTAQLISLEELGYTWKKDHGGEPSTGPDASRSPPKSSAAFMDYLDRELEHGTLEADLPAAVQRPQAATSIANRSTSLPPIDSFTTKQSVQMTKQLMTKLRNRLDYLKNPRFEPVHTKQQLPGVSKFLIEPQQVLFDQFTIGGSYVKRFTITNIGDQSRRFRLVHPLQPSTECYSLQCIEHPDPTNAMVSPGLSVAYQIRFHPVSLRDFSDTVKIAVESGETLEIPIHGQRKVPDLHLPETLDCGSCRAGFTNVRKLSFQNTGGSGRVVLIKSDELEIAEEFFQGGLKRKTLVLGNFEVSPVLFRLSEQDALEFTLSFAPESLPQDVYQGPEETADMLVYFDNGRSIPVQLRATPQKPHIVVRDLVGKDDVGKSTHNLFEASEDLVERIDFGNQNPHGFTRKTLVMTNNSDLALPYRWIVSNGFAVKPTSVMKKTLARDPTEKTFTVFPNRGVLKPRQEISFEIVFAPVTVQRYFFLGNLILMNGSDVFYRSPEKAKMEEVTVTSLSLVGECIPYQVEFGPATLTLPPYIHFDTEIVQELTMTNKSPYAAKFHMEVEMEDQRVVQVFLESASGQLMEHTSHVVTVKFYGKSLGNASGVIRCYLYNGPTTTFPFTLGVQLPPRTLQFDPPYVDFGLMTPGTPSVITVPLLNQSDRLLHFRLSLETDDGDLECVKVEPRQALISPQNKVNIRLRFRSDLPQQYANILQCYASGFNKAMEDVTYNVATACELVATVRSRKAALMQNHVEFGTCFVGVPATATVELRNLTMHATEFKFKDYDGKLDGEDFSVTFHPKKGVLKGGSMVQVSVTLVAQTAREIRDHLLLGHVSGMEENEGLLPLKLNAQVSGFSCAHTYTPTMQTLTENIGEGTIREESREVAAYVNTEGKEVLDFQEDCPIFGRRVRTVIVENKSGMRVPFRVQFDRFGAPSEQEVEQRARAKGTIPLLALNSGIGFQSASGKLYAGLRTNARTFSIENDTYLVHGHGLAFRAVPEQGYLEPFAKMELQMVVYNNLWGVFEDTGRILLGNDGTSIAIPVRVGIVGVPLRITGRTLNAVEGSNIQVNFGNRFRECDASRTNVVSITKHVIVRNLSPKTIRIDWRTFEMVPWSEDKAVRVDINLRDYFKSGATLDLGLRDHRLITSRKPFSIKPSVTEILPNAEKTLEITFCHDTLGVHTGFVSGELAYWNAAKELVPARLVNSSRADGYEFDWERPKEAGPLLVELRGRIIDANLVLSSGKSVINFRCLASDKEPVADASRVRWRKSIGLKNPTEAVVQFDLKVEEPYRLQISLCKYKDGYYRLNSNQEATVDLILELPKEQVLTADETQLAIDFHNGDSKAIPIRRMAAS